jgi:hypothetical protein
LFVACEGEGVCDCIRLEGTVEVWKEVFPTFQVFIDQRHACFVWVDHENDEVGGVGVEAVSHSHDLVHVRAVDEAVVGIAFGLVDSRRLGCLPGLPGGDVIDHDGYSLYPMRGTLCLG